MSFSGDVSKWVAKVKIESDQQVRAVVLEMFSRVIMRSPVDTGRFRGNWAINFGPGPQKAPGLALDDPMGGQTIAAVVSQVQSLKPGTTIWISNGLVYATRLEYGYSKQAPAGMVRLTAAEFSDVVRNVDSGQLELPLRTA